MVKRGLKWECSWWGKVCWGGSIPGNGCCYGQLEKMPKIESSGPLFRGFANAANEREESGQSVVTQRVEDAIGILAGADQIAVEQNAQMLGDIWLRCPECFADFVYRAFALSEQADNGQTKWVGYRGQPTGRRLYFELAPFVECLP